VYAAQREHGSDPKDTKELVNDGKWGCTRDAAIRPNKPERLRAEFSLFSLLLALLSMK
jgi:hypothetical protein